VDRQDEFLHALAARPFDRALRLVFSDWLQEKGDPRGEVIALFERGSLSLTERRRVKSLTDQNFHEWLGSLRGLADLSQTRCEGGFLSHLVCATPSSRAVWLAARDEPRLATVVSLTLPAGPESAELGAFLRSPHLRSVTRLQAPATSWGLLAQPPLPAFSLRVMGVSSWGVFQGELEPLARLPTFPEASRLDLVTSEFVNPLVAGEIRDALAAQPSVLRRFREVRLAARFGVVEGVVAWLVRGATEGLRRGWAAGERWSAEYGDAVFTLAREGARFSHLEVDLARQDEPRGLGQRIATAASVVVQLAPASLKTVEVRLPSGARLRASERDALRAASRRLGTVKSIVLQGQALVP
jgi:uncharacterized protein (TIGR02996 family)